MCFNAGMRLYPSTYIHVRICRCTDTRMCLYTHAQEFHILTLQEMHLNTGNCMIIIYIFFSFFKKRLMMD